MQRSTTLQNFSGSSYPGMPSRQQFRNPRTSLGVAGHWIHLGAVLSPLVIGELISDPNKRWRAIRLSTAVAAVASEALWTNRLLKQRAKQEEREQQMQV